MERVGIDVLVVIAPLVIIQAGLMVAGYLDLARRERVRGGQKWVWVVVLLISLIGPIVYFTLGREE